MIAENTQNNLIRMAIAQVFQVSGGNVSKIFNDLQSAYKDGRWYHTLDHVGDMLRQLEYHYPLDNPYAFKAAILYHDYIYDPSRGKPGYDNISNEAQSAIICKNVMEQYRLDKQTIQRAVDLIKMTETHEAPRNDDDAALFIDLDMSIIGARRERYSEYAHGVAKEYLSVFSPEAYLQGRTKFLNDFLKRDEFFLTPAFGQFEDQAADNMRWELNTLPYIISKAKPTSPAPALQI